MVGGKASTRLKMFFEFGTVQLNDFWILADLGLAWNLIAKNALKRLPFRPLLVNQTDVHVVS